MRVRPRKLIDPYRVACCRCVDTVAESFCGFRPHKRCLGLITACESGKRDEIAKATDRSK